MTPRNWGLTVAFADHLALLRDANTPGDRISRLCQNCFVGWDRHPVQWCHHARETVSIRHYERDKQQPVVPAPDTAPLRGEITGIFVAVRVADRDHLLLIQAGKMPGVNWMGE